MDELTVVKNKTLDKYFVDWMEYSFGYGYGTGEKHILSALKKFFDSIYNDGNYDHEILEQAVGPEVCWLLINDLIECDLLDYDISSHRGWLSPEGVELKNYLEARTVEELVAIINDNANQIRCTPTYCNCDGGIDIGNTDRCKNPFWVAFIDEPSVD